MFAIAYPDLSATFVVALIVPLVLGFIVGYIIKKVLAIGIAIAIMILLLIFLGFIAPDQVLTPILGAFRSDGALVDWVRRVAGYLPYSSLGFIVGLIVGFLRG